MALKIFLIFSFLLEIQDNAARIKAVKTLVKKLPRPNYDTMEVLFEHLKK